MSQNEGEGLSEKEMKLAIQYYDSQAEFLDKASSSGNFTENLQGLMSIFSNPIIDFFGMIINPFLEKLYPVIAPLLNDLSPIMEDLAGDVGQLLKPIFKGLADLIEKLGPALKIINEVIGPIMDFLQLWDTGDSNVRKAMSSVFGEMGWIGDVIEGVTNWGFSALNTITFGLSDWIMGFF